MHCVSLYHMNLRPCLLNTTTLIIVIIPPISSNNFRYIRGRCLISDPLNSKRRGTDTIRAEALLIDFSERGFISLRKSTLALFKFSLILLQSAIPRTLAKNANRDILPVCNREDGRKWVCEISMYNFMKQKKWRNMVNYLIIKNL